MLGVTQGTGAECQQEKQRSRVYPAGPYVGQILVRPGLSASIRKDALLCHLLLGNLFSRGSDELSTETYQEAFPHEYVRNVNS